MCTFNLQVKQRKEFIVLSDPYPPSLSTDVYQFLLVHLFFSLLRVILLRECERCYSGMRKRPQSERKKTILCLSPAPHIAFWLGHDIVNKTACNYAVQIWFILHVFRFEFSRHPESEFSFRRSEFFSSEVSFRDTRLQPFLFQR